MEKDLQDQMILYLKDKYKGVLAPYWSPRKMVKTAYNFDQAERQFNQLKRLVKLDKKMRILDVGCGFGHFVSYCVTKGYDCWGCEIDPKLTKIAKGLLGKNGQDPKRIKLVPSNRLPYKDGSFDLLNLHFVLDYAPDIPALMKELKRILVDEGRIFIIAPNYQCCYSPVYMLIFLPWLPKRINRFYFRLMKRPNTQFLESLTFTTPRYCERIFKALGFEIQNLGLVLWEGFLRGKDGEGRSKFLQSLRERSRRLKLTWLLRFLAKFGFYTPLVYVLRKVKND